MLWRSMKTRLMKNFRMALHVDLEYKIFSNNANSFYFIRYHIILLNFGELYTIIVLDLHLNSAFIMFKS